MQSGPNENYKIMIPKFKQALTYFVDIKNAMQNTLDSLNQFSGGLAKVADCRILRSSLESLEVGLCFQARKSFYFLFLFVLMLNISMLVLNFSICCSIKTVGNTKIDNFELKMNDNDEQKNLAKA